MIIKDKKIDIKLHCTQRKYYEELFNTKFKNGDIITIKQEDLPYGSRIKVECICDICGNKHLLQRVNIKDGYNTYCSSKCNKEAKRRFMTENNPNPKVDKISVSCDVCLKEILVHPSLYKKQENFTCSRECYKERRRIRGFNLLNKETEPERITRELLEILGIDFETQKSIHPYWADFYIPHKNSVIEVYGNYWHANPERYSYKEEKYLKIWEDDVKRINYIIDKGYRVLIIWEKDIHSNINKIEESILNFLD